MKTKRQLFDRNDTYSLRGICMLLIIIHHLYLKYEGMYSIPGVIAIIMTTLGVLGTGVFFLLSGYGMVKSLEKNIPISWGYGFKHIGKLIDPIMFIFAILTIDYVIKNGWNTCVITRSILTMSLYGRLTFWFIDIILVLYVAMLVLSGISKDVKATVRIMSAMVLLWIILSSLVLSLPEYWFASVLCFSVGTIIAYKDEQIIQSLETIWGGRFL